MPGDAIQVAGADNAVRVKGDGVLVAGAGDACCCCPCPGSPCEFCPDPSCVPAAYTVTFSGVTMGAGCMVTPGGNSMSFAPGSTLKGTFCLAQITNCSWALYRYDVPVSGYTNADCTGVLKTDPIRITLYRFSTGWQLYVDSETWQIGHLFNGTAATTGNCNSSFTLGNTLGALYSSPNGFDVVIATGGTATFTPCC